MIGNELIQDELLCEYLPLGIFVVDRAGIVLRWNDWLVKHSGIAPSQIVGQSLFERFPELVTRGIDAIYRRVTETGEVVVRAQRFHRYLLPLAPPRGAGDFAQMQQTARIAPMIQNDQIVGALTIIEDVTERVAQERELWRRIEELDAANRQLRATQSELQRANIELTAFNSLATMLSRSLELETVLDAALDNVLSVFGFEVGTVHLLSPEERDLILAAQHGLDDAMRTQLHRLAMGEGVAGLVAREGKPLFIDPETQETSLPPPPEALKFIRAVASAPLFAKENLVGVLTIGSRNSRIITPAERQLFLAFASQIALAADNARLYQAIREKALRDSLTNLYNHAHLHERLREEIERARRQSVSVALLMMDLDHLKRFNDTYGHPVGDLALKMVARVLCEGMRVGDIAARYGGEEFAVILPNTELDAARAAAERIRANIRQAQLPNIPSDVRVTVSIGVAVFPAHADSANALVAAADAALYRAKNEGRDRVEAVTLPPKDRP
jgi:diguanylate cyclase (GGDEF)-like protein/PAS domain S-box-containing protein